MTDWGGRKLHFVGIGGAGMSGLALVARALGADVTGTDKAESSYMARLREAGIEPVIGHGAEQVPEGAEVVYSTAIAPDNPERTAAVTQLHRADLLAELTRLRRTIAITGTHGKTTTASMTAHALIACGLDPGYLIGGALRSTGSNAGWGSGELLVVEADESDRSLLKLDAWTAVLTSAELDHHATYASRLDLDDTFRQFMARAEHRIAWRPVLALAGTGATGYDVPEPELDERGVRFYWRGHDVRLRVPGAHNALNAAAALEACRAAGADLATAVAALADFTGAGRRFEELGATRTGARVFDDYAHHPTEVRATLEGARTLKPVRLVAVFQPHLFSRTAALAREFGEALALADLVVVLDVYPARERAEDWPGVDGRLVAAAAADAADGKPVAWLPGFDAAETYLRARLRPGDVCVMLGAGNVDSLGRRLVA
jgi:UDP-N-acetylmuramate--alanine ligase